MQFAKLAAGE